MSAGDFNAAFMHNDHNVMFQTVTTTTLHDRGLLS